MEIELKMLKKRDQPNKERITVAVPQEMRQQLESLKRDRRIDVNEMTRTFWEKLINESHQV